MNMLKNVKVKHGTVLIDEERIMERWRKHFQELLKEAELEVERFPLHRKNNGHIINIKNTQEK